ncbi:osteoclast-stimulating factor 1 [Procambarus clarkii]|uniref:osteoclast-stimulating factor 1 n=1 Tax=Procambarus clarkii TaxID=6728 RepID=UPI001E6716DC|nr:osteoclast-stimulating factor 1-like [Procambarus clarkii]XP_045613640.1 osteoclast-stimulating factor 1-like [Procambarus clarkii]
MSRPARAAPPPPPVRKGQVQAFEAMSNYRAQRDCELSFEEGDVLFILDRSNPNWWLATLENKKGYIPSNYVSSDNAKVPIIDAARRGNLALLEECLAAGVSVNALDKSGSSSLHAAAQGGHRECVLRLLKEPKLEIDLQNKLGDTPLHCAAYRGHGEVVQLLLKHGANKEIVNRDQYTPRTLAKRGTIITLLDEDSQTSDRKSSGFDDKEYGANASEDSDD